MAYENLSPEELAAKFGGVPVDQGPNLEALAQKFGGKPDAYDPTSGMSVTDKVLAGIGKGFVDVGRGLGQRVGLVDQAAIDEARKYDAPLMGTKSGMAGNVVGNIATFAPAAFIPGANTVAGAAAIGALQGLAQPTQAGESAAANAANGALFGGASQAVLGSAAKAAGNYLERAQAQRALAQAQNATRDATLATGQAMGLKVPPSTVNPSFANRRLESIAGKAAVQQDVSLGNDAIAQSLIRQDLGIPQTAQLTPMVAKAVRQKAYQEGYAPVASLGQFKVSPQFNAELDAITRDATNAAKSFPGATGGGGMHSPQTDVQAIVESFRPPEGVADAAHAITASQILRDNARELYIGGNNQAAKASLAVSEAIQNELERQLAASGKDGQQMMQAFRNARQLMAKAHSAQDAMRIGTGKIEASAFGKMAQDEVPLSGNQKILGEFANAFPKAVQKPAQIGSAGVSYADPAIALLMGATGMAAGGPMGIAAGAIPYLGRPAAKSLVLSDAYQRLMAKPNYGGLLLPRAAAGTLGLADQAALGGLLGPYLANAAQ